MNENIKTFRLGELFCGPGGLALGAMNASISNPEYKIVHEWANDYDASTCDTYRRNICPDNGESNRMVQFALNNTKLREWGYPTFTEFYLKICKN